MSDESPLLRLHPGMITDAASEVLTTAAQSPVVVAVARDDAHRFSKPVRDEIMLIAGHGVDGDAHAGATVQHRSRIDASAPSPNLRQVHLIQRELFDDVALDGFHVEPGQLGENVTTNGIDLLALPRGTRIRLGDDAEVELTGLRNPCRQINRFQSGLMKQLVHRDAAGETHRRAGVMAVVVAGGVVRAGDQLTVTLPDGEPEPLQVV